MLTASDMLVLHSRRRRCRLSAVSRAGVAWTAVWSRQAISLSAVECAGRLQVLHTLATAFQRQQLQLMTGAVLQIREDCKVRE